MPIYISRGRYTSNAVKGMLANPENREEAIAKLVKSVGGKLIGWYMSQQSDDASRARAEALFKQRERQKADAMADYRDAQRAAFERMTLRRLRLARDAEVLKRMRELRRLRLGM